MLAGSYLDANVQQLAADSHAEAQNEGANEGLQEVGLFIGSDRGRQSYGAGALRVTGINQLV